jgi:hypothetical protein
MSILSASSFSDHYPDGLKIVARVADFVGMPTMRPGSASQPRNAANRRKGQ